MATPTHLHRLLLLLLLFLASVLLLRCATSPLPNAGVTTLDHRPGVYPVVLLPGNPCSQLEARLTGEYRPPPESPQCGAGSNERGRWFRLWRNATAMDDPGVAPCLADQLRLVYDPAARDFRDVPGVQTRVLGRFGSTTSFLADTEANKDLLHGKARRGAAAGRVPRRRDAVRRAVRLPASSRRAGAALPSLLTVHPAVQGARGAREQGERRQAGRRRVAQPGRLLGAGVPETEPAAVAPEVRQALCHGVHGRRRVPVGHEPARLHARRRAERRQRVHGAAVAGGVRPRHAAAGRHAGQELHGERHVGVPGGDRGAPARGDAVRDAGAARSARLPGAGGADDLHQRRRRAHDEAAGLLGRQLQ